MSDYCQTHHSKLFPLYFNNTTSKVGVDDFVKEKNIFSEKNLKTWLMIHSLFSVLSK